jgi:hypothetical protein
MIRIAPFDDSLKSGCRTPASSLFPRENSTQVVSKALIACRPTLAKVADGQEEGVLPPATSSLELFRRRGQQAGLSALTIGQPLDRVGQEK